MTMRECYDALGADYDGTVTRLAGEKLVNRIALKFVSDPSFNQFADSLAAADYRTAFRAIHTLKGLSANLGFTKLFEVSSAMTEHIRGEIAPTDASLAEAVRREYERTVEFLKQVEQ